MQRGAGGGPTDREDPMKVFVSSARSDADAARLIRQGLRDCGFDVWPPTAVQPGESWADSIVSGLQDAAALVVVVGRDTATRQWMSLEIGGALASAMPIVPVLVDEAAEMPVLIADRVALDLSDPTSREQGIEQLCEALRRAASTTETPPMGTELVERASDALRLRTVSYRYRVQARDRLVSRLQLLVTLLSVGAATIALLVVASGASASASAVAAGVGTLFAATTGYYLGRSEDASAPVAEARKMEDR